MESQGLLLDGKQAVTNPGMERRIEKLVEENNANKNK